MYIICAGPEKPDPVRIPALQTRQGIWEAIRVDDNAGIFIPCLICPLEPGRVLALERIVPYTISIPYYILYYILLKCMILRLTKHIYYTILYYTKLYYTKLYFTLLYYTLLYYTILYYTQYPAFEFFDNLVSWSPTRWRHLIFLSVTWIS